MPGDPAGGAADGDGAAAGASGVGGALPADLAARDELTPVPRDERVHWKVPALIFGGLEFTIPVLMAGAALSEHFGLAAVLAVVSAALAVQWVGNAVQGYMGASSGLSSTFLARQSFGVVQARVVVGPLLALLSMGWWAVQTAVAGNAISVMLGIDYEVQRGAWAEVTTGAGILFAIPAVLGYQSMKWTDYVAVPCGLLLVVTGIGFALRQSGLEGLAAWDPDGSLTVLEGVSIVIGVNAAQWVIASDYTRYSRPEVRDQVKIPLGIVGVGLPLFLAGAVMAVGIGSADIVKVMQEIGVPVWGFLILWFATWTSQLVNNYTMGLALANAFGATSNRARMGLTAAGTAAALGIALAGIVDAFLEFLTAAAIVYPALAGVMFADFALRRAGRPPGPGGDAAAATGPGGWWDPEEALVPWKARSTVALLAGIGVGALTQYVHTVGVPPLQAAAASGLCLWGLARVPGPRARDVAAHGPDERGRRRGRPGTEGGRDDR